MNFALQIMNFVSKDFHREIGNATKEQVSSLEKRWFLSKNDDFYRKTMGFLLLNDGLFEFYA